MTSAAAADPEAVEYPAATPAETRHLLRRPLFLAYWSGGLVSNIGTWLQNITASVVILEMTHRPLMVGVLNFATFAPVFAFSMLGGMLSDRFDRRRVVLVSQALSLVIAAVITILTATGSLDALMLVILAGLLGTSYAVAKPALSALLPALVAKDEIAHATAFNTLQFNIGQVAGSALSAMVLAVGSPTIAFALNTASFAGPIISMVVLRRVPLPARASAKDLRGSGRAGLRLVFTTPVMTAALTAVALSNASVESLRTTAPELVNRMSGLNSNSAGVLVTCYAIGATVGLLFFGWLSRRLRTVRTLTVAFALQGIGVVGTAAAGALVPAAILAVPIGLGFALNIPVLSGALQVLSPDEFRGRVMSLFSTVHLGLRPLFSLTAGALATVLDPRLALGLFAVFPVIALALTARNRAALRTVPTGRARPSR